MTAYEVPTSALDQTFSVALGGITYQLTTRWCAPASAWVLDIADVNGVALVSGIPVVTGVDLLEQYRHLGIAGQLVAQTDGDTFAVPTQSNLGTAGRLYFVTTDGATSTPTPEVVTTTPLFTRGVQSFNANLEAISGLSTVGIAVRTGNSTWATTDAVMGISVRDYGATGDGSTHDATAFQAALDAAASSATTKTVLVPHRPNGYVFEATVSIPAGVTLLGENRKGGELSRIKPATSFTSPLIQTQGYGTGRILRPQIIGLFLDGSGTTLTAMQLMMQEGIVRDCTIKNCWTYGIHLSGYGSGTSQQALNNLLENNYLAGEGGTTFYDGIFVDYHCADTTYRGNYIETATNSCVRSRGFNDMVVGNHLYNSPELYKSETSCDKLISSNYFENCDGAAINLAGGSSSDATLNAAVGGNTFRNVNKGGAANGVVIASGSNIDAVTVVNNTLRRDGSTSYTVPYFIYFNGITPTTRRVIGNIWQSGVVTTAESNLAADFQPWVADFTTAGKALASAADAAAQRTALDAQQHSAELDAVAALATTGFVQRTGSAAYSAVTPPGALLGVLEDQKTSGTNGGTFTAGAWRQRDLNTEVYDRLGILSISSNQFTISQAGTYEISWSCPAYYVNGNKTLLYRVTDSAVVAYGDTGCSGAQHNILSTGIVSITIASAKTFRIDHWCNTTSTNTGFGAAANLGTETYTRVVIRQG